MSQVLRLEQHLAGSKQLVESAKLARELSRNRAFKKLILEEFCVNECARYAHTSADPALKPEERADALALAQAAGHLKRWLSVIVRMGDQAESELEAIEEALVEARAEAEADSAYGPVEDEGAGE